MARPRDPKPWGHSVPCRAARGGTRVGVRWKCGPEPLLGLLCEEMGKAESQVSTGQLEWFHQAPALGMHPGCLVPGLGYLGQGDRGPECESPIEEVGVCGSCLVGLHQKDVLGRLTI